MNSFSFADAVKNRIVHFISDDKFFDFVIQNFNATGKEKHIYILLGKPGKPFRFIKNSDQVIVLKRSLFSFLNLYFKLRNARALVFHNLFDIYRFLFIYLPFLPRKVWCSWGGDFYILKELNNSLYGQATQIFLDDALDLQKENRQSLVSKFKNRIRSNAVKKIDFFAPVIATEFDLLQVHFQTNTRFLPFSYAVLKPYKAADAKYEGVTRVLVGNSADPSNNHIDVIPYLEKFKEEIIEIVLPLNYGGSPAYTAWVEENYRKTFGEKVRFLKEFLPFQEYVALLQSVKVAIMPHLRQQAVGNIIELLNAGSKVYLFKENLLLPYLKSNSISVSDITSISASDFTSFILQSSGIEEQNRQGIYTLYSQKTVEEKYFKFQKELDDKPN